MSFEFVHASVDRGVRGDGGFTVAALTRGLPPALEPALSELSAYDFDRERAVGADRIDWAHRILSVHGRSYTVISRTGPCGNDVSGRPNRVAHHVVVSAEERAPAGPAWMLSRFDGLHETVPAVGERESAPRLPQGDEAPRPALAWEDRGFDRGWAGIIAQQLLDHPGATCCVVMPEEVDALPLACDVLALIHPEKRWLITFSTRFQRLPACGRCQLRFLRAGAQGVKAMLAEPGARSVAVEKGSDAGDSPAARAAREGRFVECSIPASPRLRVNPVLQARPAFDAPLARDRDALPSPRETLRFEDQVQQLAEAMRAELELQRKPMSLRRLVASLVAADPVAARAVRSDRHPEVLVDDSTSRPPSGTHDVVAYILFLYSAVALAIAAFLILS
jgi:hypothetical protein